MSDVDTAFIGTVACAVSNSRCTLDFAEES